MGKNAIVGQSGGPTSVINASLAGVYESCKRRGAGKVYGMLHGVAGLLERRPVPGDRRKTQLVCTEAAADIIRRGRELQKRFAEALLTGLDRESLETFHRCLAAIDVNIDNIRRNGV